MNTFIESPTMGYNAALKVPVKSPEYRTLLIFFSSQTEREHEIMVFPRTPEVKRYNPIYFCGLWFTSGAQQLPVRICRTWLRQYLAAALRDSAEPGNLIFLGSQAI